MAITSQPDIRTTASRITSSRFGASDSDVFLRAATPPAARFSVLDLSASGFIACALCASLALSTPGAARADEKRPAARATKPAASAAQSGQPANRQATSSRDAKKKAAPKAAQVCVVKTTGVASTVARARISPIQTLRPVAASSRSSAGSGEIVAAEQTVEEADMTLAATVAAKVAQKIEVKVAAPEDSALVIQALPAPETPRAGNAASQSGAGAVTAPVEATSEKVETPSTETSVTKSTTLAMSTAEQRADATPAATTVESTDATASASEPLTGSVDFGAATAPASSTPATTVPRTPAATSTPVAGTPSTPAADTQASRLYAPSISYEGGTIVAEGTPENPVRLESNDARIIAQKVRLDTVGKTVSASGKVRVERQVTVQRYSAFRVKGKDDATNIETVTETLEGENFEYNYETRQGQLGSTSVRLANFNVSAESLTINGQKYTARNVIVRPGGLSDEELKIYGTPPFNLRLKEFTVDAGKPARDTDVGDTENAEGASVNLGARTSGKGGALYFKNTRLIPVPSALLSRNLGRREEKTYQLTPRVYYNSSDGLLVTAKLFFPFSQTNPDKLTLAADIGLSTKVGFRGGVELETDNSWGNLSVGARVNDVISSQLTSRIELDRLPEIQYRPPTLRLFALPGGRSAGLKFGFAAGDYRERFSDGRRRTQSSRYQGQVRFTTRLSRDDGPYLDLFARAAKYSDHFENLRTAGYEIGYTGPITSRIAGQFSYSATNVSGSTPFRFDEIEIRKELRATFDVMLTPRYLVPIDLRYDVERGELRDTMFGILRNYKTFAYGVTYQSARKELKLEIRQGF